MKALWYLSAFVVGALVLYSMATAIWMLIQMTAVLLALGATLWILSKVNTLFKKKPPE